MYIYIHGCEGTWPVEATPDARSADTTGVDEGVLVRVDDTLTRSREASQGSTVRDQLHLLRTSSRSTARARRAGA